MTGNRLSGAATQQTYTGPTYGTQEWCNWRNATMHRDDIEWALDHTGRAYLRDKPEWSAKHTRDRQAAYQADRERWKRAQPRKDWE